jgi:hypothetical protein
MDDPTTRKPFDPRPYLRTINTDGVQTEYLDVRWRLAWLRTEHPGARITTEHVALNDDSAVFRAMVQIPGGGCATGYGSETRDDWDDFIEKAETKAIGRALAALGYGTQFAIDFESASTPGTRVSEHGREERRSRRRRASGDSPRPESSGSKAAQPLPGSREEWDDFWRWARSLGYQNRPQLEELFEHSLDGMTPREVREELNDYLERNNLLENGPGHAEEETSEAPEVEEGKNA